MADDNHATSGEKIFIRVDSELEDLIPSYLENRRKDIKSIISFLDAGDFEEVRILGHSMKGSGGGYGFDKITQIGARIEEAAKEKNVQAIKNLADELSIFIEQIEVVYE
jgi:HPt (histidine-containing phosphotransfer) domain-containing protein